MAKWTKDQENIVRKLREEGRTISEISKIMGRNFNAIEHKIRAMKVTRKVISISNELKVTKVADKVALIKEIGKSLLTSLENKIIKLPRISLPNYKKDKIEEYSILDISDIHLGVINKVFDTGAGKEIVTYNYDIFQKELEGLRQSIFEIHGLLSHAYNLKHLYINILGDMLTNDRIFEGQVFNIDRCVGQQLWDSVTHLVNFINDMKHIYQKITVTCVVGNHGRSTPNYVDEPTENNFEYHLYKVIQKAFDKDERVEIIVPNTRSTIVEIGGHKHLLMHGDSFRGSGRNMESKVEKMYVNVGGFSVIDMGHFHNCKEDNISDKILVKYNGAWISKEEYAFKKYKKYSVPKQHFYGCNRKRPETWSYKLDLRVK